MASEAINVVAVLFPHADKAEELNGHMAELTQKVNANEPDTLIYYSFYNKEQNELVVVERYKNEAAMKAHMGSAYFQEFVGKATPLLAKPFELKKGELLPSSVGVSRL